MNTIKTVNKGFKNLQHTYVMRSGIEIADLDDFSTIIDKDEAVKILKAIPEEKKQDLKNAIGCFYEIMGWTKESVYEEFVNLALYRARYWGITGSNIDQLCAYLSTRCGDDIDKARKNIS